MMTHITGLQGGNCSFVTLSSLTDCCAHAHSLTHTQAVNYSRWGVEGAALCSVSHSAVAPAHRLLPTAGSDLSPWIWHKWQLTVACLFMQRETLYVQTLTHAKPPLRQCRFSLTGLEKQASELPGLCMLGFLFFVCVHVWQSFRQESCVLSSNFCFCFERPQLQVLDGFHLLLSSLIL